MISELLRNAIEKQQKSGGILNTDIDSQKAEAYNTMPGDLGEIDCPTCLNRGYTAYSDGGFHLRECECMPKRRSLIRIKKSGLADMFEIYTLEKWQTPEEWQKEIKRKAEAYIANGDGKWFVITGNSGSGKTHICTAICKELINHGKEVRYMLWRQEAPRLKACVNDRDVYEDEISEYMTVDVLYIDDFLKGSVTEADINLAFELLNARYNSPKLRTIISSEKSLEQILDIDEAIGSRIYERSKSYRTLTPSANWRMRGQNGAG